MPDCCDPESYGSVFGDRFADRMARRYRRRGLDPTASAMVQYLTDRGIDGATVLEIGGGVGEIQVELLRRGAAYATNLEISHHYEDQAAELLTRSGMAGRVDRRFVDIAAAPDEVEPADVVVLHRVVCCYPDYERLLAAAGSHARRVLIFSHPPRNLLTRGLHLAERWNPRFRRTGFRAWAHPPTGMVAAAQRQGLHVSYHHRRPMWRVVALERFALSAAN